MIDLAYYQDDDDIRYILWLVTEQELNEHIGSSRLELLNDVGCIHTKDTDEKIKVYNYTQACQAMQHDHGVTSEQCGEIFRGMSYKNLINRPILYEVYPVTSKYIVDSMGVSKEKIEDIMYVSGTLAEDEDVNVYCFMQFMNVHINSYAFFQ